MADRRTVPGTRRALTADELDQLLTRITNTASTDELLQASIAGLYDTLLADTGQSLASLPADAAVDPATFAIPATQWQAITATALNHANQWGTGAQLTLRLLNWAPGTYDDPATPAPTLNLPERRPEHLHLHLTRRAADVITDCHRHVSTLGQYYGTESSIYLRAAETLLRHICLLFSMGLGATTRVQSHGPSSLSLLVATGSGFVYGIIFHPDQRRCTVAGCGALIDDEGTAHPSNANLVDQHEHQPSYPLDAPTPGTWSAHS